MEKEYKQIKDILFNTALKGGQAMCSDKEGRLIKTSPIVTEPILENGMIYFETENTIYSNLDRKQTIDLTNSVAQYCMDSGKSPKVISDFHPSNISYIDPITKTHNGYIHPEHIREGMSVEVSAPTEDLNIGKKGTGFVIPNVQSCFYDRDTNIFVIESRGSVFTNAPGFKESIERIRNDREQVQERDFR